MTFSVMQQDVYDFGPVQFIHVNVEFIQKVKRELH
ncbi:unnamed protein product, partial [Tenebrio molitor]